jgi:hypothetical protein
MDTLIKRKYWKISEQHNAINYYLMCIRTIICHSMFSLITEAHSGNEGQALVTEENIWNLSFLTQMHVQSCHGLLLALRYWNKFSSSPIRVFRRHLNNIQVKLCSTYIVGRNTLETAVHVRTSSQMASFISKVWQLSTFINVTKDLHTHLPMKK